MNQLECVTNQIIRIDPLFKPNIKLLLSDIMAKVSKETDLDQTLDHRFSSPLAKHPRSIRAILAIDRE